MGALRFLFLLPVLLVFLAGVWHIASPLAVWRFRRLKARARGLATTEAPDEGALTVIRWQGFALSAFAVLFLILLVVILGRIGS